MKRNEKYIDVFIRVLITLMISTILFFLGKIIFKYIDMDLFSKENIQAYIESKGAFAPIAFIIISFLQVSFIPIPSTLTILIGSYIFGGALAFIYSYIGILLGSFFAFLLGRKLGRKFVSWLAGDETKIDYYIKKLKGKENIVLFFLFLFPFFPDDLICSIAGLLPIKWKTFILMQIITRMTTIGGNILVLSGEIIPFSGWGIPVLIIVGILCVIIFIISMKYSDKITDYFSNFSFRISLKKKD